MKPEPGDQQQKESDDMDLLWCIDCMKCHGSECPLQQRGIPPVIIADTPTVSRAVASLPGILNLFNVGGQQREVLANEHIGRKTVFGPLEAPEDSGNGEEEGFVLKVFKKDGALVKLDTSDEQRCNWMTLVTAATTAANQNLIVYQYQGALYFTVTRDVAAGQALRVWYAPNYAEKLGKTLLQDTATSAEATSSSTDESPAAETLVPVSSLCERPQVADTITSSQSADPEPSTSTSTDEAVTVAVTLEKKAGGSRSSPSQRPARRIATRSTTRKESASRQKSSTEKEAAGGPISRSKSLKRGSSAVEAEQEGLGEESTADSSSVDKPANPSAVQVTKAGANRKVHVVRGLSNESAGDKTQMAGRGRPQPKPAEPNEDEKCNDPPSGKAFQLWKKRLGKYYQLVPKLKQKGGRTQVSKRAKHSIVAKPPKRDRKNSHLSEAEYRRIEQRIWDQARRSCCECFLVFGDADKLAVHIQTAHLQKPVPCPDCKKVCLTDEQLSEHAAVIHSRPQDVAADRDSSKYRCPLCDKKLLHLRTFRNHLEFFHGKTFSCPTCSWEFWNRSKYLQHIGEHKLQGQPVEASDMYTCEKCGREFTCLSGLGIHKAFAHKEKSFSCPHCNYTTRYELTLQEHILFSHPEIDLGIPESQKLTCEICYAVFLRNRTLKHHMLNHKKREFKCNKCETVYRRKENLERHSCLTARRRTVTLDMIETENQSTNTRDMFECQRCQKLFASYAAMKHHSQTHRDVHYTCNVCKKEFHKRFSFDSHKYQHLRVATDADGSRHLIQVKEGSANKHACHLCDCHFTKMNPLIQHLETHHKSAASDIHSCIPCQLLFLSHEELSDHVAKHTRITLPKGVALDTLHSCPVCGRVFKALGGLEKHMTLHTGHKNHICEDCGKTFRRADQLKSHRLARHDKNSKMYKCNICNKSFKSNCLRLHIQWHAGQRDYQCPHCERTFTQRGNFNRHVILHTKKKEVKCDTCDRTFKHEEYLERHQLVHKNYEFACPTCNGKFSTQHFLDNHIRKVHEAAEACSCEYCGTKFKYTQSYRNHMNRKHPDVQRGNYQPVTEYEPGITHLEVLVSSLISTESQEDEQA